MKSRACLLFWALLLALPGPAAGHDARPLSVSLLEQTSGVYQVVMRAPPTLAADNIPRLRWPAGCELLQSAPLPLDTGSTALLSCPRGLAGRFIAVEYPIYNPSLSALFSLQPREGNAVTAVLAPDSPGWQVPEKPDWRIVAREYLVLGFQHIWEGPDHLLFVAGLMLLAGSARRIVLAVTGFTAAHSFTLSLATLGLVRVPVPAVEAMIALSILFLAAEIARGDTGSFSRRFPLALAFVFGLLHGFGFASALAQTGLPEGEVATGLLCFNLGVEAGQLAFIALAALLLRAVRLGLTLGRQSPAPSLGRGFETVCGYLLGLPAAYWFYERTASALY